MNRIKQIQAHKVAIQNRKTRYKGKCHTIAKGRYCWICKDAYLSPPNNPFWPRESL